MAVVFRVSHVKCLTYESMETGLKLARTCTLLTLENMERSCYCGLVMHTEGLHREVFVNAEDGVNAEPCDEILNEREDNLIMCHRLGQESINSVRLCNKVAERASFLCLDTRTQRRKRLWPLLTQKLGHLDHFCLFQKDNCSVSLV